MEKRQSGAVKMDGAYVKYLSKKGPIEQNMREFPEAFAWTWRDVMAIR